MRCEQCGAGDATPCPGCGRVCCADHHGSGCRAAAVGIQTTPPAPHAPTGVRRTPPGPPASAGIQAAEGRGERDRVCVVCGEPAAGACESCGQAYCVHHRGGEAEEDATPEDGRVPVICWNCRLTRNAKAVLFWVTVGGAALGVLIAFLSRWM